MQIIRNISTEQRFFEVVNSMPNPTMNLYSGIIFDENDKALTIAEAKNENGTCLYRYVVGSNTDIQSFEKAFKTLKKELEDV